MKKNTIQIGAIFYTFTPFVRYFYLYKGADKKETGVLSPAL